MAQNQYSSTKGSAISMQRVSSNDNLAKPLLSDAGKPTNTLPMKYKIFISVSALIAMASIISSIVLAVELNNSSSSDSSKFDTATPKNLILLIGDGMGTSYNAAYRIYKNKTFNFIDAYFKGRYSTSPTNSYPFGITDSAAGAVALASGVPTQNRFLGTDENMNPVASILAAAKRQGKGTGIISTKSVTDATPAAFTAHTIWRYWSKLIAHQQATRQYNAAPLTDVMFGGGKQHFETLYDGTAFWNDSSVWRDAYHWNTLVEASEEFINLQAADLPVLGLLASNHFPYYLDRINGESTAADIPDLEQMSMKAIELLHAKYGDKKGFFLMIEGAKIDYCGHDNDIVCLLWEMEEFEQCVQSVMEFAEMDGDTLVVVLADHETGGLSIGRDASLMKEEVVHYVLDSMPRDWESGGIAQYWGDYIYSMEVAPPDGVQDVIENQGLYKFYPWEVQFAKHTAEWLETAIDAMLASENETDVEDVYALIEENYLGNVYPLSEQEKRYINNTWLNVNGGDSTEQRKYAPLMNARTLTGWTTHGHTGADISLYAYGPSANRFYGHRTNYEIGQLLSDIFGVLDEQKEENEWLLQQFMAGIYPKLCDETQPPNPPYLEWNESISYPDGNVSPDEYCVQQWIYN